MNLVQDIRIVWWRIDCTLGWPSQTFVPSLVNANVLQLFQFVKGTMVGSSAEGGRGCLRFSGSCASFCAQWFALWLTTFFFAERKKLSSKFVSVFSVVKQKGGADFLNGAHK